MTKLVTQDMEVRQGNNILLQVTAKDRLGAVVDITTISAIEYRMARTKSAGTALVTKSLGDGITVIDAPAGRYDIAIDAADTSICGEHYHGCKLTDGSGDIQTGFQGVATIERALF